MLHVLTRVDALLVRSRCAADLAAVRPDSLIFDLGRHGVRHAAWALPIVDALLARFPAPALAIAGPPTAAALLSAHVAARGRLAARPAVGRSLTIELVPRAGPPRIRPDGPGWRLWLPRQGGRCVAFSPMGRHAAAMLGDSGFMAGLDVRDAAPILQLPAALSAAARRLRGQLCAARGAPLIALLPVRDRRGQLDLESLWQAGDALAERIGGTVVQVGGPPAPAGRGPRVDRAGAAAPLAAALLRLSAVSLSEDSGWCHVAAACEAPVAAVFGRSDPIRQGPVSARAAVLWADAGDCGGCDRQGRARCLRCVPRARWVAAAEQVAAEHWPRDRLRALGVPL